MFPFFSFRLWIGMLVGITAMLGLLESAHADDTVQVTVVTILATNSNSDVDPQVKEIAKEVQKAEPNLTGFRLGRQTSRPVKVGGQHDFRLVDSEVVSVAVKHGVDQDNRVGLTVKPPQGGEIDYTSTCNKFFPIVTRYQTNNNDRLILAIMVEPGKK